VFSIINCRKGLAVKTHLGALVLATGVVIGALTSVALRAQNPPPAFTIAEIQVTDPETFKQYATATGTGVPAAGGRFIVRSGKSFIINGEPPKSIAVIQWDSLEQARTYFESADYKKLASVRDKGSKFRAFSIEGAAR
jgi:uncharacterized protein (DUF1330 family)